jgi:hypothetical protein
MVKKNYSRNNNYSYTCPTIHVFLASVVSQPGTTTTNKVYYKKIIVP